MNLEEIDLLLANWKKKIDLISQNLIDLYGLATYQRLTGTSGFSNKQLTGISAMRVSSALQAMNDLFQHFDLLVAAIDRAVELRKQVPRFLGSEHKIYEIEKILKGESIQLAVVQIPLAQRGLLSVDKTAMEISPNDLLVAMTSAFQVARDVVLAVDEAWTRLETVLADAEAEILSLQKLADSLPEGSLLELAAARQKITVFRTSIETDPLGVQGDFENEIKPLITRLKTTLEKLIKQKNQIKDSLEIARKSLIKLIEFNRKSAIALAESKEKVVDHSSLKAPLPSEQIEALSQWLHRLETKFNEGLINPVSVGLENWNTKVKEYMAAAERALAANKAPLEFRQELRGRLDALKAKALARGLAENAVLGEIAENAKQLLYSRPTPLDQAAKLVVEYEKRLNGL